jgi:hypothetical protein
MSLMVLVKIAQTARAMRTAQKGYFATGSAQRLSESKGLERRLDELLEQEEQEAKGIKQASIFSDAIETEHAHPHGQPAAQACNTAKPHQVNTP